jgi:hypothetical protein
VTVSDNKSFLCFSTGGGTGGTVAKDALGNDIKASAWLASHQPKDYSLCQGIKVRFLWNPTLPLLAPTRAEVVLQVVNRCLTQGFALQGDATYLIVKDDGSINDFGLNAICTHLGCVVPWVAVCTRTKSSACWDRLIYISKNIKHDHTSVLCRLRTSSSARATALSTIARARSSVDLPLW